MPRPNTCRRQTNRPRCCALVLHSGERTALSTGRRWLKRRSVQAAHAQARAVQCQQLPGKYKKYEVTDFQRTARQAHHAMGQAASRPTCKHCNPGGAAPRSEGRLATPFSCRRHCCTPALWTATPAAAGPWPAPGTRQTMPAHGGRVCGCVSRRAWF